MILFDIETTGLDPYKDELRVFGQLDYDSGEITVKTASSLAQEERLVHEISHHWKSSIRYNCYDKYWGGWNITEFDFWFIAVRAQLLATEYVRDTLPLLPVRVDEGLIGKYGKPRMTVPGLKVTDLAYEGTKALAEMNQVKWSLQPVAEALGWKPTLPGFRERLGKANTTVLDLARHCIDDLEAIAFVYDLLDDLGQATKDAA